MLKRQSKESNVMEEKDKLRSATLFSRCNISLAFGRLAPGACALDLHLALVARKPHQNRQASTSTSTSKASAIQMARLISLAIDFMDSTIGLDLASCFYSTKLGGSGFPSRGRDAR